MSTHRIILWIIGFFAFLNVYSMQSVLPLLAQEFHASPVEAGMTIGATVLGVALTSPFIGMLSDAIGRKLIICSSMAAITLPTALIAMADSLQFVLILRFAQGLAIPGIAVVTIAYIAEEFRTNGMARMTALYVGGTVMGGFCGRFITGHAGEWLGWRGAYGVLALLNLGGAVFTLWRLPASRNFVPHRDWKGGLEVLRRHLQNRTLLAACAVGFCVLFSLVGAFTYVNLHLADPPFNLSPAHLANVFGVYLVGVVVTPIAGRYIARLGFLTSLLAALAVSAVGWGVTLWPHLGAVITGLMVGSVGIFICQSATISFISSQITEGRSLATGLYYMSYYAGGAVGAWGVGLAYESWSWSGSVVTIGLLQALAATIALVCWPRPVRATPAHRYD